MALPLAATAQTCSSLLDRELRPLAGKTPESLCKHQGKVLLIVNTASKCGLTPQYEALEALHARLAPRGFAVLGFPSNDFLGQEPGTEEEIQEFCTLTYGVTFPMYEKVKVKGKDASPLYLQLRAATGDTPGWNFHKYLIGRDGEVAASFGSRTRPDDEALLAKLDALLAEPGPTAPESPPSAH
ncbi:glutathione peroxidase [Xanthomonadaceae bacterium JHOS43]|nr:glutathione peroxidase [Xanthomonadaceae bacterium JHOS43]